jgi:acetoin utilization deacetylase AcuC-like enzyme
LLSDATGPALDLALSDGFIPDFVLLSCGFDWAADDPEGGRGLSPLQYYEATVALRAAAGEWCDGRLVSVLEGGYGPELGRCTVQHLRGLAAFGAGDGAVPGKPGGISVGSEAGRRSGNYD